MVGKKKSNFENGKNVSKRIHTPIKSKTRAKTELIVSLKGALSVEITCTMDAPKLKFNKMLRKEDVFKISAKLPLPSTPSILVVMMEMKKPTNNPKICVKN